LIQQIASCKANQYTPCQSLYNSWIAPQLAYKEPQAGSPSSAIPLWILSSHQNIRRTAIVSLTPSPCINSTAIAYDCWRRHDHRIHCRSTELATTLSTLANPGICLLALLRTPPCSLSQTSRHDHRTISTTSTRLTRGRRDCLFRFADEDWTRLRLRPTAAMAQTDMASTSEPASLTPTKKSTPPEKKYKFLYCNRPFSRSERRSRHERSRMSILFVVVRFLRTWGNAGLRLPSYQHFNPPR